MTKMTGNTKAILLILALGIAAVPITASAKGGHGPRATFEELDQNNDGQITQAEMDAHAAARFAAADTNGDGSLSAEELMARSKEGAEDRMTKRVNRMVEHLDTDGNGLISADELSARKAKHGGNRLQRMDADNSGGISKEEFETAVEKHRGKRHKRGSDQN